MLVTYQVRSEAKHMGDSSGLLNGGKVGLDLRFRHACPAPLERFVETNSGAMKAEPREFRRESAQEMRGPAGHPDFQAGTDEGDALDVGESILSEGRKVGKCSPQRMADEMKRAMINNIH